MAFENDTTNTQGKGNKEKAEAWGNVVIKDKAGNEHVVSGAFIPLTSSKNQLHRSLVNLAKSNGGEVVLSNVTLTVKLAAVDDGTDLELI